MVLTQFSRSKVKETNFWSSKISWNLLSLLYFKFSSRIFDFPRKNRCFSLAPFSSTLRHLSTFLSTRCWLWATLFNFYELTTLSSTYSKILRCLQARFGIQAKIGLLQGVQRCSIWRENFEFRGALNEYLGAKRCLIMGAQTVP